MAIIVKAHKNDHISYENPILNLVLYVITVFRELVNAQKWLVNDRKAAVNDNREKGKRAETGGYRLITPLSCVKNSSFLREEIGIFFWSLMITAVPKPLMILTIWWILIRKDLCTR